ncbi:MAG: sulfurtransferase TusA family protein [Candidatus Limnocylindrales bacterium]
MSQAVAADRVLDCTGLLCPMPIVKLSKTIKEMAAGQVLLMEATDPGSIPDVAAWSENTGHPIVGQSQEGRILRFWIQKAWSLS